jgi:hypothetical protein
LFLGAIRKRHGQCCVSDLSDYYAPPCRRVFLYIKFYIGRWGTHTTEASFLGVMPSQPDSLLLSALFIDSVVADDVGGDWGVVGDLFDEEVSLGGAGRGRGPEAVEEFAEDGV